MFHEPPGRMSLADLASPLRAGAGRWVANICGRDASGRVERLLERLRAHGVALWRRDVVAAPGFDDEVMVLFSHGPVAVPSLWLLAQQVRGVGRPGDASELTAARAQPIPLLLPAVQCAREAARRLHARAGPAFRGGLRVAAGDVNGDFALWRTNFGSAGAASQDGFDVIVDGRIITAD